MISSSSSLSPYELLEVNDGFAFITDRGASYLIYFTDASSYFPGEVYAEDVKMFGFTPYEAPIKRILQFDNLSKVESCRRESLIDPRIADTIVTVVQEYLSIKSAILLFICESKDNKEAPRNRLFDMWYRMHYSKKVIKRDLHPHTTVYASLIYRVDNPNREQLEESIPQVEHEIQIFLN